MKVMYVPFRYSTYPSIFQSLVQLETLGEFGVFFILFTVGLEFSPANLKKVFKVATAGTVLMTGEFLIQFVNITSFSSQLRIIAYMYQDGGTLLVPSLQ